MENKNILLIAGIFILGLVIGGIFSGGLTGRASNINTLTQASTSILIFPAMANDGGVLKITVDSRRDGASPSLYLRDSKNNRKDKVAWCRGLDDFNQPVIRTGTDEDSKCFARVTFEYKLLNYSPGTYYIEVFDVASGDYAKAYFEVVS